MSEDRWAGAVVVDDDDDDDLWADSPSPVKPRKSKGRRRARSRRKSKDSNKSDASSPSSPDVEANSAEDASTPSSSSSSRRKSHKENLTPPSASSSSSQTPSSKSKQKSKAKAKANARTKSRGIEPSKFHRGLSPAFNSAASTPVGNNNPGINDTDDDETPRAAIGGSSTVTNATSTGSAAHRPPLAPPPPSSAYTPLTTITSSSSTFTSASISPPPTSLSRLKQILSDAQMRLIQNKRREVTTQLKIKRAAYRDVTELRTWPLQELALEDLDRLLDEHMGRSSGSQENGEDDRNAMNDGESNDSSNEEQLLMSGFASDSSGISTSSIEEPKRSRRGGGIVGRNAGGRSSLNPGEDSSPGKATLRARYAEEFRLERSIRPAACCRKDEGDDKEEEEEKENSSKADGSQLAPSDLISSTSTSTSDDNQDGSSSTTGTSNGAGQQQQQQDFLPALWCMEPRIFSVEKSAAGKRRYLVGHLGRFMDMYWRKSDSRRRHYYELIREGTPCRLYLDLEFTRAANPDIDDHAAEQLVTDLIEELRADLKSVYGHDVDRSAFVDLDSSTEKKFSRHLIIHLPNQGLFVDAPAAGSFIRHVVGRLAEEIAMDQLQSRRPTLAKHLFVRTKTRDDGGKDASARTDKDTANGSGAKASSYSATQVGFADDTTCFVDMGVYTRNRLFRLLGSAKFGKPASAALRIASANTFPFPLGFGNEKFYVPDQERAAESDSHQIPVSSSSVRSGDIDDNEGDDEVDLDDPEIAQFFSSMDWSAHADALASTLVVPVNFSKINYPILQGVEEAPDISRTGRVVSSATKGSTSQKQIVRSYPKSSVGTSPFSSLDDYIADVLGSRGGSHGSIRAWSLDDSLLVNASKPCYITYHMKDNRFCERIGRQHKSNNVMWTVDLERMVCYQSCHDPECRAMGFRGELLDLPSKVQEAIREVLFDYELASLDEQVLLDKAKRESSTTRSTSNGTGIEVDEAFEKALLALDISGKNALERTFNYVDKSGDKDEWDDALSQALLTNPELFP